MVHYCDDCTKWSVVKKKKKKEKEQNARNSQTLPSTSGGGSTRVWNECENYSNIIKIIIQLILLCYVKVEM